MASKYHTRRSFLLLAGAAGCGLLRGQSVSGARASVAEMERGQVLAEARDAVAAPVETITANPAPHGDAGQFFSETEPNLTTAGASPRPKLFRAHARALRRFSATVACLSAAYVLTSEASYAQRAAVHVRAWLLAEQTRMQPSFDMAGCAAGTSTGTPMGVVDLVPLAELARGMSFLTDGAGFSAEEMDGVRGWFAEVSKWLGENRAAFIARESKDHRASAWLLIASAIARFSRDESALEDCRKRFRGHTLRNQVRSDGVFPQEVATPNPYRNTLFNFDMLAGACQLLSSPFDALWDYELVDGVGMRVVAAYLYPVIAHPEQWTFVADAQHFRDLPGRRPGLLFAGRAYNRAEYVDAWRSTPPVQPPEDIAYSFPIREPLLWTARAPHGM